MRALINIMNIKDIQSKFNRLSKREKFVSVACAAVFLILFMDLLVVRPLYESYLSLEVRTIEAEKRLEQNIINITMKEDIDKRFEEYRKFIKKPAPKGEEEALMLSEIEKTARTNDVLLVDIKPQDEKILEFYKQYTVNVDVETEMKHLVQFLYQIETSSQMMRVVKAKLGLKERDSQIIKARLTIIKTVMGEDA